MELFQRQRNSYAFKRDGFSHVTNVIFKQQTTSTYHVPLGNGKLCTAFVSAFSKYIGVDVVRMIHLPYDQSHNFGYAFFLSVIGKAYFCVLLAQRCRKRYRVSHWECYFVCCLNGNTHKITFSHTIELKNPDQTCPITKCTSQRGGCGYEANGVALTNTQHQCIMYTLESRRRSIAFPSVFHSGGKHKKLSQWFTNICCPTTLTLYAHLQLSQLHRKADPKVWLGQWHRGVILTTTSATASVSIGE